MNSLRAIYNRLPVGFRSWVRSRLPDSWLRWYAHQNTDVYLISYPKCGRTWLRLMIGWAISEYFHLPQDEEILFLRSNRRFHSQAPRITVIHEDRPMLKAPEELTTDKSRFRGKKVIFLARDPRDVIVSSYFEMKNRSRLFGENPYEKRQAVFDGELDEFLQRRIGGFDTILAYYNIWAQNRHVPAGFLLVRYEDLKANPAAELRRVLDFLGLEFISDDIVAAAVNYASFENMRKMEAEGRFQSKLLQPADQLNQDTYKTRKGKIKGYMDYLNASQVEALNRKLNDHLAAYFGYNCSDEYAHTIDRI